MDTCISTIAHGCSLQALTLHQPFATAVAVGVKRYETRTWKPTRPLIGERIAVHAGKTVDRAAFARVMPHLQSEALKAPLPSFPAGFVLATATLEGCYRISRIEADTLVIDRCAAGSKPIDQLPFCDTDRALGNYATGRWVWLLTDITRLSAPVAAIGNRRLWAWRGSQLISDAHPGG